MPSVHEIAGHVVTLPIERFGPPGAFLRLSYDGSEVILLPGAEVPEGAAEGDPLEVFVYFDSEDRPIATTKRPKLVRGEVRFLEVVENTRIGAFVDWGLAKDLLVPHVEQTTAMEPGKKYAIALYLDPRGRLAGTAKVSELLHKKGDHRVGEWVRGEAWRKERGIGVFVIVEGRWVGLVPESEVTGLTRGEACDLRVAAVLPDGKIELSLRRHAHEEMQADGERILDTLRREPSVAVGDHSSPGEIRDLFGMSKKAFKRAAGGLLREKKLVLDGEGCFRLG